MNIKNTLLVRELEIVPKPEGGCKVIFHTGSTPIVVEPENIRSMICDNNHRFKVYIKTQWFEMSPAKSALFFMWYQSECNRPRRSDAF